MRNSNNLRKTIQNKYQRNGIDNTQKNDKKKKNSEKTELSKFSQFYHHFNSKKEISNSRCKNVQIASSRKSANNNILSRNANYLKNINKTTTMEKQTLSKNEYSQIHYKPTSSTDNTSQFQIYYLDKKNNNSNSNSFENATVKEENSEIKSKVIDFICNPAKIYGIENPFSKMENSNQSIFNIETNKIKTNKSVDFYSRGIDFENSKKRNLLVSKIKLEENKFAKESRSILNNFRINSKQLQYTPNKGNKSAKQLSPSYYNANKNKRRIQELQESIQNQKMSPKFIPNINETSSFYEQTKQNKMKRFKNSFVRLVKDINSKTPTNGSVDYPEEIVSQIHKVKESITFKKLSLCKNKPNTDFINRDLTEMNLQKSGDLDNNDL